MRHDCFFFISFANIFLHTVLSSMFFLAVDSMTYDIFYDAIFYDYLLACRPRLFFMKIIFLAPDVK